MACRPREDLTLPNIFIWRDDMDIQYLLMLQNAREAMGGVLNDFFLQISDLSYGIFIWMLACMVFWGVDKKSGRFFFLNVGFSRFFMQVLKLTFCIYRPWVRSDQIVPVETASGYSFPSGHSVTAAANYGTVIQRNKKHKPLCIFMGFMILLTIFSRNYIGVHTPQDVVVGTVLGLAVVFLGTRVWEWMEAHPEKDYYMLLAGVVLTVLFLIYITVKSYPMDYADDTLLVDPNKMMKDGFKDAGRFLGVTMGWFLERRFVRFSMKVSAAQKVTRCSIGALLLIFYEKAFMPWLTGIYTSSRVSFVLTFLELIVLMVIYPLCFSRLEGSGSESA